MQLIAKEKMMRISTLVGVAFVLLFAAYIYFFPHPKGSLIDFLENGAYDFQLKNLYRPVTKDLPVLIVDVDDESLLSEGRWPWPRNKLADLVTKLFDQGAAVVGFDMVFPEREENRVDTVTKELNLSEPVRDELNKQKELFDFDSLFAKSLQKGNSILGFVFKNEGISTGALPPPLLKINPETAEQLYVSDMKVYLANIEILQSAAKRGAFINASPDPDGVHRYAPLVLRHGNEIFPGLALEAVKQFLEYKDAHLVLEKYGDAQVLEGIRLENRVIPTNPYGRILIPYRGPPFSIPYVSAKDVLNATAEKSAFANKLIFIGSSATATGDLVVSPMAPSFVGVEVHATIASGIIENYLPWIPPWNKGISVLLVLILGLSFAIILPIMEPIGGTIFTLIIGGATIGLTVWIWIEEQIVLSAVFGLITLAVLYLFNMAWGFLVERRNKQQITSIFGSYVPPDLIKKILEKEGQFSLEGETKELTVLFSDIRGFTTISESMNATELKAFLNEFFTPMTEIIFNHRGTIDKYVGDMIMAFWGAPAEDPQHAADAVAAAIEMHKRLDQLNETLKAKKLPEIKIGIGINTGVMNVGDMGSKFRLAYTVIGDAVNLASRLESISKFYGAEIVVGEETYKRTEKLFAYRKLDRVRVKGKGAAIDIYDPVCSLTQCDAKILEYVALHNRSEEAYCHEKWDEAEAGFTKLLNDDPESAGLYKIYLERIANFRKNPPGAQWERTHIFDKK